MSQKICLKKHAEDEHEECDHFRHIRMDWNDTMFALTIFSFRSVLIFVQFSIYQKRRNPQYDLAGFWINPCTMSTRFE